MDPEWSYAECPERTEVEDWKAETDALFGKGSAREGRASVRTSRVWCSYVHVHRRAHNTLRFRLGKMEERWKVDAHLLLYMG